MYKVGKEWRAPNFSIFQSGVYLARQSLFFLNIFDEDKCYERYTGRKSRSQLPNRVVPKMASNFEHCVALLASWFCRTGTTTWALIPPHPALRVATTKGTSSTNIFSSIRFIVESLCCDLESGEEKLEEIRLPKVRALRRGRTRQSKG